MNHAFGSAYAQGINIETWEDSPISWINEDMENVYTPYYDPIMIKS